MNTKWTKTGCRPLELDEQIEPGDWVADVAGEDLTTGVPCRWTIAHHTIGKTPRMVQVFACRPLGKDGH